MNLRRITGLAASVVAVVALLTFGLGYAVGHERAARLLVPNEDTFKVDTQKVLGATLKSLQAENKLVIYRFRADVRVSTTKTYMKFFKGQQQLIVPATVVYFIDMAELAPQNVSYDEASKAVIVKLPPLKLGDVAMQPEAATQINGGLVTMNNDVVAELARINYAGARQGFVQLAQNQQIVEQAKAQAIKAIAAQFEVPLRAVGNSEVTVRVSF